jgi:hypothetical protein
MPRIVVIIDELAELMLSSGKQVRQQIEILLSRISNLGRAVGVHIIAATQLPQSSVIPARITGNMTAKLGARTGSFRESLIIVGKGGLEKLPVVKGRMILKVGADEEQIQTPHVQPDDTKEAIAIAYGRQAGVIYLQGQYAMLDAEGTCCYIADHLGGNLGPNFLVKALAPLGVPLAQLSAMVQELMTRESIAANGRIFDVVRGARSYKLVEQIAEPEERPAYEQDFSIDPAATLSRLRLASPEVLMLPAPGETSEEGKPPPQRKPEPAPEPEPISPMMLTDMELVEKYIAECCNRGPRLKDKVSRLYSGYEKFCEELNVLALAKPGFGKRLKALGYKPLVGGGNVHYWGGLEYTGERENVTKVA